MKILNWLLTKQPGQVNEYNDRFEISHDSGEHSTLWKRESGEVPEYFVGLGDIYIEYDGMDLFSSTFKISANTSPKSAEGVEIVDDIEKFNEYVTTMSPIFPEESIPFMYQAGIGLYAVGKKSGRIYEWDTELSELSGEYVNLEEIFEEWLNAIT